MAAVAFPDGSILWAPSDELEVVSVDGKSPEELLQEA